MNPQLLELQSQGGKIDIQLHFDSGTIGNMQIDGFVPVIINISPVTTLPILLNIHIDEDKKDDFTQKKEQQEILPEKLSRREAMLYWVTES